MAGLVQCIVSGDRKAEPCFPPYQPQTQVVDYGVAMESLEVNIERSTLTIKGRLKIKIAIKLIAQ